MSFLLKWLRPPTSSRIALRPQRTLELPVAYEALYDRVLDALRVKLGANVYVDDRAGRSIEAGFGLVNSERLRVSFDVTDASRTVARIEAIFPAGMSVPPRSASLDALADAIESGISA
jgi:hypothetical protein